MSDAFRIQSNTTIGVFSPWLHSQNPALCPRWPRNHAIIADFTRDNDVKSTFEAPGTVTFGGVNSLGSLIKFSISEADRALRLFLQITVGVPTGTPGTYIRLARGAPMAMLGNVEYQYQQKQLYQAFDRELLWATTLHEPNEKSIDRQRELYLTQTPAQRNTLALATQTFYIPIPNYWIGRYEEEKSPILRALTERIELRISMGSIGDILETDYTVPALTIVGQPQLHLERDAYTIGTRGALNSLCMTPKGVVTLYREWQTCQLTNLLASGTTDSGYLRVTSMRREGPYWLIVLRPATATTAYAGARYELSAADLPTTIEIRTANGLFMQETNVAFLIRKNFRRFFTSPEYPVIPIVFADDIESPDQTSGSMDFTYLPDLDIRLRWTAGATTRDLRVDLDAATWNAQNQQGTQIQRVGN